MKKVLILLYVIIFQVTAFAQSRSDIFDPETEITWLGLDFSEVHFIGDAAQWQDVGAITSTELRDKYFVSWNELFVDEKAKYDVAKATNRILVKYAVDVTATINANSEKDYFVNDPGAFRHLENDDVAAMLSKYDYKGKKGIGMMFVVEGMYKEAKKASMWVVFVDMGSKKMLLARQVEGVAGGFGFRNYWAKAFLNGLKEVGDNFDRWKKGK
ncbi:MAG: hypothetical protein H6550_07215 [Chitinophagales bacterium]|nr:hypothetical protein [Chitinophagales bacterium]